MWKPKLNFISLHYTWILFCSLLSFPVLYSARNLSAVDAFFFGASGSTESGLNTVDVKDLKTYQQVYIHVIPIITNLMVINLMVVVARLYWFQQRLKSIAATEMTRNRHLEDLEANAITENEPIGRNEAPQDKTPVHTEAAQPAQTDSEQNTLKDTGHNVGIF